MGLFTNSALKRFLQKSNTWTASQKYGDSVKMLFGTGSDLEIYHNGTISIIDQVNAAVQLFIINSANHINMVTGEHFKILDEDDAANPAVFDLDTTARTLALGSAADPLVTTIYDQLTIRNQGAGADPVLFASNSTQILKLKGGFRPTSNLEWESGVAQPAQLDHANSAPRVYTFPDKAMTVADANKIMLFPASQAIVRDDTGQTEQGDTIIGGAASSQVLIASGANNVEYFAVSVPSGAIITDIRL